MNSPHVVGLGLSTLDIVQRLEQLPTWDNPGRVDDILFDGGGPVATALATVSRFGESAGFVGTVGDDWVGEMKLRSLRDHGVDVTSVVARDQPETQVIFCYVDSHSGERIFTGSKRFGSDPLQVAELDEAYIVGADLLHLDGFHHEAALQAAHWMQAAGKTVVLDGSAVSGDTLPPQFGSLVEQTDVLVCGDGFVQALTGESDDIVAATATLDLGPEIVVITKGAEGSHLVTASQQVFAPAFPVDVVDTTGAGDVFHGAFIYGLLQKWDLEQILEFSSATAALECTRLGGRAGIPTLAEVQLFLQEHAAAERTPHHDRKGDQ